MIDVSFADSGNAFLDDLGKLVATIPHLLGFRPTNSMVVVGWRGQGETVIDTTIRMDVPPVNQDRDVLARLMVLLVARKATGVALVGVGGNDVRRDNALPYRDFLDACQDSLAQVGIPVLRRVWASSTVRGARWECYDHVECVGFVPGSSLPEVQPRRTDIYAPRDDLVATLAPIDDAQLVRRSKLLDAESDRAEIPDSGGLLQLVETALERAVDGMLPETDQDVVALVAALSDHAVRDVCLVQPDQVHVTAVERLWTSLVRGSPSPECAEPACLLALSAYQRGDGVLAGIALDRALTADSTHRLSLLAESALWVGLSPDRIARVVRQAADIARHKIATDSHPDL